MNQRNEMVITPALFKEQVIVKITSMLKRRKGGEFIFEEPIDMMGEFAYGVAYDMTEKRLYLAIGEENAKIGESLYKGSKVEFYDASEFFIEQLWDAYFACSPIYEQSSRDYATIS